MIRNLRNTWRNLKKNRATSFINIGGLAIGLAASVLIFLWVQNELSYDNFHSATERIHRVKCFVDINKGETWVWETSPLLLAEEMQKQIPELEDVTRVLPVSWSSLYLKRDNQHFAEPACAYVDDRWFNVFQYKFVEGSATAFNRHPFSLIITESRARKYFGSAAAIGKTIRIDTVDYTVQGVVRDNRLNSSFQFDVLIPLAARLSDANERTNSRNWGNFNYLTFVKLLPGADKKALVKKATALLRSKRDSDNVKVGLIGLQAIHFESDLQSSSLQHGNRNTVNIFIALGLLILLVACINYVNLTTARASLRMKEVSIKKIVGAGRAHLLLQFIGETVLMSLVSLAVSIGLITALLPVFNRLTEKQFRLDFNAPVLWYIFGGTLAATILLTSVYPAILLSSFKPVQIFRNRGFLQVKDSLLRKGLVVVQFTFSIALIIGVLVISQQLDYIQKQNNRYARSQVLSFAVPWKLLSGENRGNAMAGLKEALLSHTSIEEVSLTNQQSILNMTGLSSGSADWEGRPTDFNPAIAHFATDDDFIKVLPLEIVKGKWFEPGTHSDLRNVLVNETAVKELRLREPVIGQRFMAWGDTGVITGIVKDFHFRSLHDKIGPLVIKKADRYLTSILVKSGPAQITAAAKAVEKTWKQYFPGEPISYNFLDEEFDKLYKADQKSSLLVSLFAGITVLISCLGLFGLATFTAERRTKEIGIRKVLGAGMAGIVQLLSKEFLLLVGLAFVLASPIAWYAMNAWLQDFAYRINISWWLFALAGLASIAIALVTVCFQAIRAAMRNPVLALRSE